MTPVPPHSPPPIRTPMVDDQGRVSTAWAEWFKVSYAKMGEASTRAPILSRNITEQLDVSSQVTGELASGNLVPNAQTNVTNFATVDSIDAGADATIRVYGPGGVATPWTRVVGGITTGPYPSATFPGFPYASNREVYFRQRDNSFFLFDPTTEFISSLDDELLWIGRVKTVAAGGAGGVAGGGGPTGSLGGGRYSSVEIL